MDLNQVKGYLRVDGSDDDILIGSLMLAAHEYLRGAGAKNTESKLYQVVQCMLIALFYEHRDTATDKITIPPVINNLITQLAVRSGIT
jgi:uncharacterized phage protein (predicted DNA packaging)